jgi:hypothetical protein
MELIMTKMPPFREFMQIFLAVFHRGHDGEGLKGFGYGLR